jgi:hypothetical protein
MSAPSCLSLHPRLRSTMAGVASPAALTNFFARPGPQCHVAIPAAFSAGLDQDDCVVHLSPVWDIFSPPAFRRRRVLYGPVGWFIADDTTRECFRALFERVRRENRPAKIITRWKQRPGVNSMQLTFTPRAAGAIAITWSFFDGSRTPVAEERRHPFDDGEFLRMCSWCQDVHMRTGWQRLDAAAPALGLLDHRPLPLITHGICPACSAALSGEISSTISPAREM